MSRPSTPAPQKVSDKELDLRSLEGSQAAADESTVEVLVKSTERVRDLGEVFTPAATVDAMLDLLPDEVWNPHPSFTFFEPACGDGNFLVAILDRKLRAVHEHSHAGTLPAGQSADAVQFHALEALASIYAVDISPDNVIGGTPGHEVGARQRLINLLRDWCDSWTDPAMSELADLLAAAEWIAERNIIVGNMLPFAADGSPSGREGLPIVEYQWKQESLAVTIYRTTLGSVMDRAQTDVTGVMSLFSDVSEPTWSGPAMDVAQAQVPAPSVPKGPVRNGNGRKGR